MFLPIPSFMECPLCPAQCWVLCRHCRGSLPCRHSWLHIWGHQGSESWLCRNLTVGNLRVPGCGVGGMGGMSSAGLICINCNSFQNFLITLLSHFNQTGFKWDWNVSFKKLPSMKWAGQFHTGTSYSTDRSFFKKLHWFIKCNWHL